MPIADCQLLDPTFVRDDARGSFIEVVNSGPWETVLTGSMRAGAVLGNHYHKLTRMFLFLTSGAARVDLVRVADGSRSGCRLTAQHGIQLPPNHSHAVRFLDDSTFILLKSRAYREDAPDTYPYPVELAD